jgi:TRAP-type C4-dicarboxylate transport system permease small subunit
MPMVSKKGKLDRFLDLLNSVMAGIAATMMIFMMLAISYSVMMRYLFNRPIAWIVEISSYLMLYITFLGTAWLLRREGHVEIDLFTGHLSPKQRAVLRSVTSVGGATVGFVLTWKGVFITIDYFRRGVMAMDILNTPQYLLMAIIPVGGFLLMIEFILRIFRFGRIGIQEDGST